MILNASSESRRVASSSRFAHAYLERRCGVRARGSGGVTAATRKTAARGRDAIVGTRTCSLPGLGMGKSSLAKRAEKAARVPRLQWGTRGGRDRDGPRE